MLWILAVLRLTVHVNADIPAAGNAMQGVNDDVYVFLLAMGAHCSLALERNVKVMQSLYDAQYVADNIVCDKKSRTSVSFLPKFHLYVVRKCGWRSM